MKISYLCLPLPLFSFRMIGIVNGKVSKVRPVERVACYPLQPIFGEGIDSDWINLNESEPEPGADCTHDIDEQVKEVD